MGWFCSLLSQNWKEGDDERQDGLGEWKGSSLSSKVSNAISFVPSYVCPGSPNQISLLHRFSRHDCFFLAIPFVVLLGKDPQPVFFLGLYTQGHISFLQVLQVLEASRNHPLITLLCRQTLKMGTQNGVSGTTLQMSLITLSSFSMFS